VRRRVSQKDPVEFATVTIVAVITSCAQPPTEQLEAAKKAKG
jgi:hypothetical protein